MSNPTFESIRAVLERRLTSYIGQTTVTPELLKTVQQQVLALFGDINPGGDPVIQITAADARNWGMPVSDDVPDCAVMDVEFGMPTVCVLKPDTVQLTMIPKTKWQWISVNLVVPSTQESQQADHQ